MEQARKLVVVTGATSGIGFAFASRFAAMQYDLLIISRNSLNLERTAYTLQQDHRIKVTTRAADLTRQEDVDKLAAELKGMWVSVLVNSAGFKEQCFFVNEPEERVKGMLNIFIYATTALVHAVLPGMIAVKEGTIITVSSLGAFDPAPGSSIYTSSKAFQNTFMESLHMEVAEHGIRVQSLCPGLTHTGFHQGSGIESTNGHNTSIWMEPGEVVEESLEALEKGKVVYIPGTLNRIVQSMVPALPRKWYYRLAGRLAKRFR